MSDPYSDLRGFPPEVYDYLEWLATQPRGKLEVRNQVPDHLRRWATYAEHKTLATRGVFLQITDLGELALELRNKPKAEKGRRCRGQATGPERVLSALAAYHKYDTGGSVLVHEPAKLDELVELSGVSKTTVSKFLADKLGKPAYKHYKARCAQGRIGSLLARWRGELPDPTPDLMAEEYGRRRDD